MNAGACALRTAIRVSSRTAYLPAAEAQRLFARPGVKMARVFAPRGRATPARREGIDGHVVSGTWSWGSGSMNADFVTGGCLVLGDDGKPRMLPDGTPEIRSMVFDAAQVTIADTWQSMGLAGTGSHDFSVTDAFVPATRSAVLMSDAPMPLPLYSFPVFCLLGIGIASVALGIARVAVDALVELAQVKTPQGANRVLAERASTQQRVARAEARLRSGRLFLLEAVDKAWRAAQTGNEIPVALRRDLRLATTHATDEAAAVVDAMYACAGGSAIFASSPLQKCLRDVHVVTQHMMVGEATYEMTGRLFLGLPMNTAML